MKNLILAFTLLLATLPSFAISRATLSFLALPVSPTVNGYGGVLLPSSAYDPLSPMLNPATLGFLTSRSKLNAAFYPERTQWGPNTFMGQNHIRYSARSINVGANSQRLGKWLGHPTHFSAGVGYNEVLFDYGETVRRGSENESLGTNHPRERATGLSFGLGYENRIRAAAGFSIKYVESHLGFVAPVGLELRASVFSHDLGVMVQVPLMEYLRAPRVLSHSQLAPFFTPCFSYAITDLAGAVSYTGNPNWNDPMPRTEHVTFALATGITLHENEAYDWNLLSLEVGIQAEDELIIVTDQHGSYDYQWPLSDINPVRDFIGGASNDRITKQRGVELGLLEIFFLRRGSWESTGDRARYETDGVGVRLSGILKLAGKFSHSKLAGHFDVEYSMSKFRQYGEYHAYDGLEYQQLSLYLNWLQPN